MEDIPGVETSTLGGLNGQVISAALPLGGVILGGCRLFLGATQARRDFPAGHNTQQFVLLASMLLGVCALYGFIGAGLVGYSLLRDPDFTPHNTALAAGLVNGMSSGLSALSIGVFSGNAVGCGSQQPRLFTSFLLALVFLEAFALYGLLISCVAVTRAHTSLTDMTPETVLPFASVSTLANMGGLVGSVAGGAAVMEVGVAKPWLVMKCMLPVVFSGVTGIYGLITSMADMQNWPPRGDDSVVGLLYLSSGTALAYVGYHSARALGMEEQGQLRMAVQLISCQALGLLGLIFGLYLRYQKGDLTALLATTTQPPPPMNLVWQAWGHWSLLLAPGALVTTLLVVVLFLRPRPRSAQSTPLLAPP